MLLGRNINYKINIGKNQKVHSLQEISLGQKQKHTQQITKNCLT